MVFYSSRTPKTRRCGCTVQGRAAPGAGMVVFPGQVSRPVGVGVRRGLGDVVILHVHPCYEYFMVLALGIASTGSR